MKRFVIVLVLFSASLVCLGATSPGRLQFNEAGFSIQPLEGQSEDALYQTLIMFLPPSDGFSPNVNVQIQPYEGTIEAYIDISEKQFADAQFKLIAERKTGASSALMEYSGNIQGRELHWYARAIATGKAVYLVTATATETQWETVASRLKKCVDSFVINKGEQDDQKDVQSHTHTP